MKKLINYFVGVIIFCNLSYIAQANTPCDTTPPSGQCYYSCPDQHCPSGTFNPPYTICNYYPNGNPGNGGSTPTLTCATDSITRSTPCNSTQSIKATYQTCHSKGSSYQCNLSISCVDQQSLSRNGKSLTSDIKRKQSFFEKSRTLKNKLLSLHSRAVSCFI